MSGVTQLTQALVADVQTQNAQVTVSNSLKATLIAATAEGGSNPRHLPVIHHAAWRK